MRLSALRAEITQSFGLAGQVLRPSEYYSASTKRIESLLDEFRTTIESFTCLFCQIAKPDLGPSCRAVEFG